MLDTPIIDCTLNVQNTKKQIIGSISVRLELKPSSSLNPITVRNDLTRLQSAVFNAELDKSGRLEASPVVQKAKAAHALAGEMSYSGLEKLERVTGKLEKLLENLKPVVTVMDEASKVDSLLNLASIYKSLILRLPMFIPTLRPPGPLPHRSIKSVYHLNITRLLSSNQLRGAGVPKESQNGQRYRGPRRGHRRRPLIC